MVAVDGCCQSDDNAFDTGIDRTEGVLYLGQHTTADGAVSLVAFEVGMVDDGYYAIVIVRIAEYSFLLKGEDEGDIVEGCQCLGSFRGYGVGIGVEDMSLAIVRKWSHDRDDASLDETA